MKTLQKIAIRLALFAVLLIGMNFLYAHFFFEKDIQTYSPIINQVRDIPDNTNILYIGESSNITAAKMDADKRAISDFLGDHYPALHVHHITKPASHAGIYKVLLNHVDPKKDVKTVVVTLNLRSFNAQWINSGLETPLQKSLVLLKDSPPLYNRFLLSFKDYPNPGKKELESRIHDSWESSTLEFPYPFRFTNLMQWKNHIDQVGVRDEYGIERAELSTLAKEFISTYAFQIDIDNNPRIRDFEEIIELAEKRNWNLVFNLLSENVDKAQELVGDDLVFLMRENRDKLVKHFRGLGVTVIDNLEAVADENFIDKEWPTEHYYEEGRKRVAENIANGLKKFHPNQYQPKIYDFVPLNHFTNSCDGSTIWSNMGSLTTKEAYSGKTSSETNVKNNFSISFNYPYQKIVGETKNYVQVSMMVKGKEFNNETVLVIDVSGDKVKRDWHGRSLDHLTIDTDEWQRIEYTFPLGYSYNEAEMISIYVLNLSDESVFVDDIDIRFQ